MSLTVDCSQTKCIMLTTHQIAAIYNRVNGNELVMLLFGVDFPLRCGACWYFCACLFHLSAGMSVNCPSHSRLVVKANDSYDSEVVGSNPGAAGCSDLGHISVKLAN